jgi:hypothetical protein
VGEDDDLWPRTFSVRLSRRLLRLPDPKPPSKRFKLVWLRPSRLGVHLTRKYLKLTSWDMEVPTTNIIISKTPREERDSAY